LCLAPCRLKNHYLLNHPHAVKLKDVFVTSQHLNIVLELAESGMLFEYVNKCLKQNNGQMQEDDAR
jgi:serine/threonine protein kinase